MVLLFEMLDVDCPAANAKVQLCWPKADEKPVPPNIYTRPPMKRAPIAVWLMGLWGLPDLAFRCENFSMLRVGDITVSPKTFKQRSNIIPRDSATRGIHMYIPFVNGTSSDSAHRWVLTRLDGFLRDGDFVFLFFPLFENTHSVSWPLGGVCLPS